MASWTSEAPASDQLEPGGPTLVIDRRAVVRLGLCRLARDALAAEALPAAYPATARELAAELDGRARLVLLGLAAGDDAGRLVAEAREATGAPVVVVVLVGDASLVAPAMAAEADGALVLDMIDAATLCALVGAIERGARYVAPELTGWYGRRAGPAQLTERCIEVLRCLADGLHDDEVSAALNMSASSVRKHVRAAEAKLHARTRTEAIARAVRAGLL
jgi:DNA-binding NarL/FixJ family response regulator